MSASERLRAALALVLLAVAAAFVPAQADQPGREQELIRRLRQQVQQLQDGQAAQQQAATQAGSEKAELQRQLDQARAELVRVRAGNTRSEQQVQAARHQLDEADSSRTALQAQLDRLQAEAAERSKALEQARSDIAARDRKLAERDAAYGELEARQRTQAEGLATCSAHNERLLGLGKEILQHYADMTTADLLGRKEPFLQWHRVALENQVQGYDDKLDREALAKAAPTAAKP